MGSQRLGLFQGQHLRRREQGRLQRSRSVGCSTVDELIKAVRDDKVADSDVGRRVAVILRNQRFSRLQFGSGSVVTSCVLVSCRSGVPGTAWATGSRNGVTV